MKSCKKPVPLRLPDTMCDMLEAEAERTGKSRNGIIEEALIKYFSPKTDDEILVELFLKKFDEKYKNMFTRIRLAAGTADRNIQALLHIKNTELYTSKMNPENFISLSEMEHKIITDAKKEVKEQIALYKQRKDDKRTE